MSSQNLSMCIYFFHLFIFSTSSLSSNLSIWEDNMDTSAVFAGAAEFDTEVDVVPMLERWIKAAELL